MAFTGNEDHSITLATASEWTKAYRDANPNSIIGHYFGGAAIEAILAQQNCVGIRIYYAINDVGVKQLVVTGVDGAGNDLYNGVLAERSYNCPPDCSNSNPLNS